MRQERYFKAFAIYNDKKHQIHVTRQTGRLNVFDRCQDAERVKLKEGEEIVPVYIMIPEVLDDE